jgi:elongation factor Tu
MDIRELLAKNGSTTKRSYHQGFCYLRLLKVTLSYEDAVMELVKAMDDYIEEPTRDLDKPFLMPIEDVFSIKGRGTVATGRIEQGIVKLNDEVEIVGIRELKNQLLLVSKHSRKTSTKVKLVTTLVYYFVVLSAMTSSVVKLLQTRFITPHTEFDAEVYILKKEEGGRHTPFFKGYKPQFYFRTTDVTGEVELPADKEMVMPGDTVPSRLSYLLLSLWSRVLRFAIREGGRTVGAGVVTKITSEARIS